MGTGTVPIFRIKNQQNAAAGALFTILGLLQAALAWQYDVGSFAQMGPGLLPAILGLLLAVLGVVIGCSGLVVEGPPIERGAWRPVVLILAALVLFALLIDRAGLVVGTFVVVMLGGMAHPGRVPWLRLMLLGTGMAALTTVLFVYLLGQPIPVWGVR